MARGWDSKSVEAQIDAVSDETPSSSDEISPAERDRRARRAQARLCRARILQDLEVAHEARYRAMLERALTDIDAQLAAIEAEATSRASRA
jgi:hypothetical protein